MRQDHKKFIEQNTEILVFGREDKASFLDYWQKNDLPFVGIPDPTLTVLKLYGQEVNLFKLGRIPAQVIIDKQGLARFAHYGHDPRDISLNVEVLELLKTMNKKLINQ